jgi:A118 family predicted phage portal protein
LEVDVWKDLKPEATITGIEKPLFGYFRYPMANNIDTLSPLGISCFARAAVGDKCLIQQADEQWSNLLWEFESGQRALYADVVAFGRDEDGKPVLPMKRLYRALNGSADIGDEGFFKEWSPSFREASILAGLEAILRRIEFVCGLAYGTLSNPETVDRTATELKISQQRSYATITDTQKALKETLDQLLYGMDTWATLNNLAPAGSYEVNYDFDDSVIVDKGLQFQQDMQLVSARLMSDVEFRIRNFGESEEEAKKQLALVAPELSLFDGGV